MKIIDFKKKGQSVRFFLGEDDLKEWYGDDWNDRPYEHNAGLVYDEFVSGITETVFPFDALVLEPRDGVWNSSWCKDDMKDRKVPCIVVVSPELALDSWEESFAYWAACDCPGVRRYYFGDRMECVKRLKGEDADGDR